jgi:hypothetical protein
MLKLFKFYLKPQCENSSQKFIKDLSFKGYFDEYLRLIMIYIPINYIQYIKKEIHNVPQNGKLSYNE